MYTHNTMHVNIYIYIYIYIHTHVTMYLFDIVYVPAMLSLKTLPIASSFQVVEDRHRGIVLLKISDDEEMGSTMNRLAGGDHDFLQVGFSGIPKKHIENRGK